MRGVPDQSVVISILQKLADELEAVAPIRIPVTEGPLTGKVTSEIAPNVTALLLIELENARSV